ncbi:MAG: FAD:protein FMN transferase [Victivallaceae bacterium]|nr:FAD:protein FMN transferase [Victivallaceae bacterium]
MTGNVSLRTRCGLFLGALLLAGIVFFLAPGNTQDRRSTAFPVMGTVGRFDWYAPHDRSEEVFDAATAAAREKFDRIVAVCNLRDPASELSRLNASASEKKFICSETLWDILRHARAAYRETEGVFDVSVKPLMDLWGFYRKRSGAPSEKEIAAAQTLCGLDKIIFDEADRGVSFPVRGMAIDLDGIAKGYALDQAAQAARRAGVRSGALDLGGNLYLLEPPAGEPHFSVGIRSPGEKGRSVRRPELEKVPGCVGISTSGNYERFTVLDGKRYGHVLDPATGRPAEFRYSATVIAPTATEADYLSTALYLKPELAEKFRARGVTVLLVSPDE